MMKRNVAGVRAMRFIAILFAMSAAAAAHAGQVGHAAAPDTVSEALRVRIDGKPVLGEADLQEKRFGSTADAMAEFRKNVVPLRRNSSVQLAVEVVRQNGRTMDVTTHPATTYQALSPARLSVSADGRVTAAPSPDAPAGLSGDVAVLILYEHGTQQAWNKVFFDIIP